MQDKFLKTGKSVLLNYCSNFVKLHNEMAAKHRQAVDPLFWTKNRRFAVISQFVHKLNSPRFWTKKGRICANPGDIHTNST